MLLFWARCYWMEWLIDHDCPVKAWTYRCVSIVFFVVVTRHCRKLESDNRVCIFSSSPGCLPKSCLRNASPENRSKSHPDQHKHEQRHAQIFTVDMLVFWKTPMCTTERRVVVKPNLMCREKKTFPNGALVCVCGVFLFVYGLLAMIPLIRFCSAFVCAVAHFVCQVVKQITCLI